MRPSSGEEQDNAFLIEGDTIRRREGGRECSLTLHNGTLVYEDALCASS